MGQPTLLLDKGALMDKPRIIDITQLRREIRNYGITRMAKQIGCSRTHIQRICGGQRNPGKRILAALCYEPLTYFRDTMSPKHK